MIKNNHNSSSAELTEASCEARLYAYSGATNSVLRS